MHFTILSFSPAIEIQQIFLSFLALQSSSKAKQRENERNDFPLSLLLLLPMTPAVSQAAAAAAVRRQEASVEEEIKTLKRTHAVLLRRGERDRMAVCLRVL